MHEVPRLPRCEGAGKLPILGNLTEGVYDLKMYTPPVSFADIIVFVRLPPAIVYCDAASQLALKTRGTRDCASYDSTINNHLSLYFCWIFF